MYFLNLGVEGFKQGVGRLVLPQNMILLKIWIWLPSLALLWLPWPLPPCLIFVNMFIATMSKPVLTASSWVAFLMSRPFTWNVREWYGMGIGSGLHQTRKGECCKLHKGIMEGCSSWEKGRGEGGGGGWVKKEWGMGHGAWGMGHGACCAMGRGGSVGGSVLSNTSLPPPQWCLLHTAVQSRTLNSTGKQEARRKLDF